MGRKILEFFFISNLVNDHWLYNAFFLISISVKGVTMRGSLINDRFTSIIENSSLKKKDSNHKLHRLVTFYFFYKINIKIFKKDAE